MDSTGYESRLKRENVAADSKKLGMAHHKSCECCDTSAPVSGSAHFPKSFIYLYTYSRRGSICSGLDSCFLGYVCKSLLLFLHLFPLNLIILRFDVNVLWGLGLFSNYLSKEF
jgi:hypothetical protein